MTTSRTRRRVRTLTLTAVLLPATMLGACQKTALRPDDQRSQFDRYDLSRSQRAQPYLEDEFGRRTPNLKDRLLVRED